MALGFVHGEVIAQGGKTEEKQGPDKGKISDRVMLAAK